MALTLAATVLSLACTPSSVAIIAIGAILTMFVGNPHPL
jgi:hypothetical protein